MKFSRPFSSLSTRPTVLVTGMKYLIQGAFGQLGNGLMNLLKPSYNIVATDIRRPASDSPFEFKYLDVTDANSIDTIVAEKKVDIIVHFSALLSAIGEKNPERALKVNMEGFMNVLEASRKFRCKLFCPSTIGAFGTSTPKQKTPDFTIMRPSTIYGITKVHMELMGEYYHKRYDVDFRSARFPGVISSDSLPGGGTTDYAIEIFHDALNTSFHRCFLGEKTRLPMIYISDVLEGVKQLIEAPNESLTQRVYNMGSMDFTPAEIAKEISKRVKLQVEYKPDFRQAIADSWPQSLDDSAARKDWNWNPKINLSKMVDIMLNDISAAKK